MEKLKICVVGAGRWGLNHIKTLFDLNVLVGCVDEESKKLKKIKSLFPKINCFSNIEESFEENFHGYIIATPASSHANLAKLIISNNKPVLVEKPLSLSVSEYSFPSLSYFLSSPHTSTYTYSHIIEYNTLS